MPTIQDLLTEDGKIRLKVDGEELFLTAEELAAKIAEVQKSESAEKRWQAAAEDRAAVARLKSALIKSGEGDVEAYAQILDFMGVPANERQEYLKNYIQQWDAYRQAQTQAQNQDDDDDDADADVDVDDDDEAPPQRRQRVMSNRKIQFDDLDDNLKLLLGKVQEAERMSTRQKIFDEVSQVVDSDAKLGKLVKKGSPGWKRIQGLAKQLVKDRIRDGEPYGPQLVSAVVNELRETLEEAGLSSVALTPPAGLGLGPGLSHLETKTEAPPAPLPMGAPGYRENALARLVAHVRRAAARETNTD